MTEEEYTPWRGSLWGAWQRTTPIKWPDGWTTKTYRETYAIYTRDGRKWRVPRAVFALWLWWKQPR